MKDSFVRIKSVEITNFKNVRHGKLELDNTRKPYKASVLGLYGQNGSGKTALIDALSVLKNALSGKTIPESFVDFINVDSDAASLRFEFKVVNNKLDAVYSVIYEFSLRKDVNETIQNTVAEMSGNAGYKLSIFDEVISYSCNGSGIKSRMQTVVDTRTDDVFVPASKFSVLTGNDKSTATDLLVSKKIAKATSRSFVFSGELLNVIRRNCKDEYHNALFEALIWFGNYELFIIDTTKSGLITLNALPLNFKYDENGKSSVGSVPIDLNKSSLIPQEAFTVVRKVINNMNIVLTQLIPGLSISAKELGTELLQNGSAGVRVQLVSHKNNKDIPLKYESEGIKKIISVLQLLIVVYNKSSITVAIDELDSGVFEYLLGELLRIISEKGKGQLIFTSHNLRPLETIDKGFIAFTTTNSDNRYIRFSNVKTNNNLRDFYYRDIVLGEQDEEVYNTTNNYEISLAFREAGEIIGT